MGMRESKNNSIDVIVQLLHEVFTLGLRDGYDRGYDHGYADGLEKMKNSFKPAISDGLRKGSTECGKKMNSFK